MDTALRRQPRKAAGGGGSGKAVPLAGALDINYTCWNSRPIFCFQMCSQYNHGEEREKRKEAEACKQEMEYLSHTENENGSGGELSLASVLQLIECAKRGARSIVTHSGTMTPSWGWAGQFKK